MKTPNAHIHIGASVFLLRATRGWRWRLSVEQTSETHRRRQSGVRRLSPF